MLVNISFFLYIFASFVGVALISSIVLIVKTVKNDNRMLNPLLLFVLTSVVLGCYYFIEVFYMRDHLDNSGRTSFERILDISLYMFQVFFWFKYLRIRLKNSKGGLETVTNILILIFLLASSISYAFFMDGNYYVSDSQLRTAAISIQLMLMLTMTGLNSTYIFLCLKRITENSAKLFLSLITFFIFINGLWNGIIALFMINGRKMIGNVMIIEYDMTSVLLLIINLLILIYIFKNDFNTLFNKFSHVVNDIEHENKTEQLLKENLTEREREIAFLLINGYSYSEIGEKLYISKYTVKRHAHNIYSKLNISSRLNLINKYK